MIVLPAANRQQVPLTCFTHAKDLIEQALTASRTVLAAHDARPARARAVAGQNNDCHLTSFRFPVAQDDSAEASLPIGGAWPLRSECVKVAG